MQRVIVCGGRDYADRKSLYAVLDAVHEATRFEALIHGNAKGADQLADDWAADRAIKTLTFTPLWEEHGKAAGPMRNQKMLDVCNPHLVLAFPGGRGTADMIRRAELKGVPVVRITSGVGRGREP